MLVNMLNDDVMSRRNRHATACNACRQGDRVPYPGELVLAWMHDLTTTIRYRVVDVSDGGFRIRSSAPLTKGMTGVALRLIPEGAALDKPVMVVWSGPCAEGNGFEAGLRYF